MQGTFIPTRLDVEKARSPIVAPATVGSNFNSQSTCRLDSHVQSSSAKSPCLVVGLNAQKVRTSLLDEPCLPSQQATSGTVRSDPMKATVAQSSCSAAHSQPVRYLFKNDTDALPSPKKLPVTNSEPKPTVGGCRKSIFRRCVSIFGQQPNLMGGSPGLNQFSLRHLDGQPVVKSFPLDHL